MLVRVERDVVKCGGDHFSSAPSILSSVTRRCGSMGGDALRIDSRHSF